MWQVFKGIMPDFSGKILFKTTRCQREISKQFLEKPPSIDRIQAGI